MVPNWPRKDMYLDPADDGRIASLRRPFRPIQPQNILPSDVWQEAFQRDRSIREGWVKTLPPSPASRTGRAASYWLLAGRRSGRTDRGPGDRFARLVASRDGQNPQRREMMLGIEIEPHFAFNKIEQCPHPRRPDHPRVRAIYDPSHFDVMNGAGAGRTSWSSESASIASRTFSSPIPTARFPRHLETPPVRRRPHRRPQIARNAVAGRVRGLVMFDAWDTQNPYDACHKGRLAVEAALRRFALESNKAR